MKTLNILATTSLFILLTACSNGGTTTGNPLTVSTVEDTSTSGAAAAAVGGALSSSSPNGTIATTMSLIPHRRSLFDLIPEALAATVCPTFVTPQGSGCSATGGSLWITYNMCSFLNSKTVINGTQSLIMSSGSATCGHFPNPGASQSLISQYVTTTGSTAPSAVTYKLPSGVTLIVDDSSANLANFDRDTIPTIVNGGYGSQVAFNSSGVRNQLVVGHREASVGLYDHTVSGTVDVSESSGASSRNVTGKISVYFNSLQVVGSSTFNVVHSDSCCLPVSGTITTTFAPGANVSPTALGLTAVGKTETLTLTGCGKGTLENYDGSTVYVNLTRCY